MGLNLVPAFLVAVVPITLFLVALLYLDSYKLLRVRDVLEMILVGGAAGLAAYFVNAALLSTGLLATSTYSRYGSPLVEECLKALLLLYLIRSSRVGFLVDAGICGFAVGSGFALVENLYYLYSLPSAGPLVWIVRGCGTAMMHGSSTAIFAIITKLRWGKDESWKAFVPGLLPAIAIHSFFNHFFLSPLLSSVLILLALPPLTILTFTRSERALEKWLGVGFDTHAQLLELIHSGEFRQSKVGRYLHSLREYFSPEIVVDMLCYMRIQAELSMLAKGMLLARQRGFDVRPDESVKAKLKELGVLEASIGATGKLAMAPVLGMTSEDEWQLELLAEH